ncbi:WG repeat-containing protein [Clostridium tarantellae]|uniref:DUF3298 domain-containing protein n=1 Tax=Clostridium tarantellae TaxID=39493 RepID=A0A6I1MKK0_9CLOT|nr:WG repeat-containing protein [Clostridium tarantellae]MPQ43540.1 DUF3298 domain-containing protein [Clostridium tarantellae]
MSSKSRKEKMNLVKKYYKNYYEEFSTSLYPAFSNTRLGNFYGYINNKGNWVIYPEFQYASFFYNNKVAIVKKNDLFGVINLQGQYIVKPIYNELLNYKNNLAIYDLEGKKGIIDICGNKLNKIEYDFIEYYGENMYVVAREDKNGIMLYGYIDKFGNEIIIPKYVKASKFINGYALIKDEEKYFLINKLGEKIKNFSYKYIDKFNGKFMTYSNNDEGPYGYIDIEGNIIISQKYATAGMVKNNLAIISCEENIDLFGVINIRGEYIYPPIYNNIKFIDDDRLALGLPLEHIKNNLINLYAIGDLEGNLLCNFKYLNIDEYKENVASVYDMKNTFFIDRMCKVMDDLPKVKGSGSLVIKDNLIYADIDYNPYYLKVNGKVIYYPNIFIKLNKKYSVIKVKYKGNINYLVYYPKLNGMKNKKEQQKVNRILKSLSMYYEESKDENVYLKNYYYTNFEVQFFNKNLFIPNINSYHYTIGDAHGISKKQTPIIDLNTGVFYKLKDLFYENSKWDEKINNIIENKIKEMSEYKIFQDGFKGINENVGFYVNDKCLFIYFNPYEIAPYSSGIITFKISFNDLEFFINKESDFYKAFN